jgi:membrane-associated phospholipid phosphatase
LNRKGAKNAKNTDITLMKFDLMLGRMWPTNSCIPSRSLRLCGLVTAFSCAVTLSGCAAADRDSADSIHAAIASYQAGGIDRGPNSRSGDAGTAGSGLSSSAGITGTDAVPGDYVLLALFVPYDDRTATQPTSAPTTAAAAVSGDAPPGYWRPTLIRQAGGEMKDFLKHDGWVGFKDAFWNVENALVLAGTMGASIAIRESGVDDAVRRRTAGEFKLGGADETIQILGNPATHFAGAGLLWLGSAATKDLKNHEAARALGEALIVNGLTTMALKVSTDTRGPDGDNRAWPSGHTSSAFTTAAVLNEYYGPWVGVPSLALAGLVGYQRIDSRVHDFSDVAFGAVLGYVVGSSIAREQKAEFPELFGLKLIPFADPNTGATGLALLKSW